MTAILGSRLGLRVEESQGKPSHATQIKMLTVTSRWRLRAELVGGNASLHATGHTLAIVPFLGVTRSIFHVLSCCFKANHTNACQLLRVTFSCSFRSGSVDPPTFEDISLDSSIAPFLVTIT